MLANRVYLGEAVHQGVAYPGEHAPIVDQRAWGKAHAVMSYRIRRVEMLCHAESLEGVYQLGEIHQGST